MLKLFFKLGLPLLLFLSPTFVLAQEGEDGRYLHDTVNLLVNEGLDSFENGIAQGWKSFSITDGLDIPGGNGVQPEFYRAVPGPESRDLSLLVRSGSNAQGWATPSSTAIAGIYQVVPVTNGATLRLSAWTNAWSSDEDGGKSANPAWVRQRIGIDPTGETDPRSQAVKWSVPANFVDEWGELALEVQAEADYVTVYLTGYPNATRLHNNIYYDDVELFEVAQPLPSIGEVPLINNALAHSAGSVPSACQELLLQGLVTGCGTGPGQQGYRGNITKPIPASRGARWPFSSGVLFLFLVTFIIFRRERVSV